ncbi:MAG: hypothetical protein UR81_C0031G0007 [Candidatus Levybacteria bacterium GW2011_GWB1_35_5]|nr:MAG: hypothetical protein UR81_C0031G0007 [Candidatus Levybacteria bacterium GW2011_GWB1_35_5]
MVIEVREVVRVVSVAANVMILFPESKVRVFEPVDAIVSAALAVMFVPKSNRLKLSASMSDVQGV